MYVVPSSANEIKVPMTNWTAQRKPANKFNCARSDEEEILCIKRKKWRKLYQNRYFILGLFIYVFGVDKEKKAHTHTWNEVFVDITQFLYTYILVSFGKSIKYFPFISFNIQTAFAPFIETKSWYSMKYVVEEKAIVKIPLFDWKLNVSHLEHNIDSCFKKQMGIRIWTTEPTRYIYMKPSILFFPTVVWIFLFVSLHGQIYSHHC